MAVQPININGAQYQSSDPTKPNYMDPVALNEGLAAADASTHIGSIAPEWDIYRDILADHGVTNVSAGAQSGLPIDSDSTVGGSVGGPPAMTGLQLAMQSPDVQAVYRQSPSMAALRNILAAKGNND